MVEPRLTLITLGVKDLAVSERLYEQNFGWLRLPASNESILFFQLNGIQLALFPRYELAKDAGISAEGYGFRGFSLAHNLRSEQAVDELIFDLENRGLQSLKDRKEYSGAVTTATSRIQMGICGKSHLTHSYH